MIGHQHGLVVGSQTEATPWEINGWNLQITSTLGKENDLPILHDNLPGCKLQMLPPGHILNEPTTGPVHFEDQGVQPALIGDDNVLLIPVGTKMELD